MALEMAVPRLYWEVIFIITGQGNGIVLVAVFDRGLCGRPLSHPQSVLSAEYSKVSQSNVTFSVYTLTCLCSCPPDVNRSFTLVCFLHLAELLPKALSPKQCFFRTGSPAASSSSVWSILLNHSCLPPDSWSNCIWVPLPDSLVYRFIRFLLNR